jgi:hypothetical protein
MRIVEVEALDIRFPTSRTLDGSDAMNPDPDYLPPLDPGYSAELRAQSLADHRFPDGAAWT